ncbi:hypothetical protein [Kozakia baliensis]|uniref:hypothetical protein n=1 Tax=Kozakia baliensis TaxID=153496 RepID=UPI00068964F5|nr:hypothetical protein [Kozakia baliensis]AOX19258.1 hypothetical protein A0U90_01955 [Kozakia baliensis]
MSTLSVPKIAAAVVVVLALVIGGALVKLGLNPPLPEQTTVHKDLPASRFVTENTAAPAAALPAMPEPAANPAQAAVNPPAASAH